MKEQDYTDPIVEQSTEQEVKDSYGPGNPVGSFVDEQLEYQEKQRDEQLRRIDDRRAEQKAKEDDLAQNPDPFLDNSDYFGLVTSGQIDNSLDSVNDLDVDVRLESKDYYWNNEKVKQKFIDQYGEADAKTVFDEIYKEVDNQYYNLLAENSLLGKSSINTAVFADNMDKFGKEAEWQDYSKQHYGDIVGSKDNAIVSVEEKWANRGIEIGDSFYADDRSAEKFNLDYYKDPETKEIKPLTKQKIDELENSDDFLAFKYDSQYLHLKDSDRAPRYVTVLRKGDEVKASDRIVSSWDLGDGIFSNNVRENPWYKTIAMAIPKFGTEVVVGSAEAANNILMVGSALLAGDSLDGSEWGKWLSDNDAYLRSKKISSTQEAREQAYTSLDGITDLVVNVTSQFAAAYLMGAGVGGVTKAAMGYKNYANIAKGLGTAGKSGDLMGRMSAANRVAGKIAMKAGKAGNIAGKSLMTSMAMGDIYQVGKENGLTNREAASVAALAYGALWKVLEISENVWRPYDLKQIQKQYVNLARSSTAELSSTLQVLEKEATAAAAKKGLTGSAADKFIKSITDRQIVQSASKMANNFRTKLMETAPKLARVSRDAGMEGLEEVMELWTQEGIKSLYNVTAMARYGDVSMGEGRFEDWRDPKYFSKKMDESIQSFIGGFLGGGIMSGVRGGFRSEEELTSLSKVIAAGKVDEYVKTIMDGYDNKDTRIYDVHDYQLTTKRKEDDSGYQGITQELRSEGVKTIAEIKRDLLLQEINEIQTNMELDNIRPMDLSEETNPTVMQDYAAELTKYLGATSKRESITTGGMAATDGAMAQSNEESAAKSKETQAALENVAPALEENRQDILKYARNMNDIVDGLSILNNIKNEKIAQYEFLNKENSLTKDNSLFDKMNAAQAQEINSENNTREQRVERAGNLATTIQLGITNLDKVNKAITGRDKETDESSGEEIDYGTKYLFESDKKDFKKQLETQKVPMSSVASNDAFMGNVKKTAIKSIEKDYKHNDIYSFFGVQGQQDLFSQGSDNVALFLDKLAEKRADRIVGKIKGSKTNDEIFKALHEGEPDILKNLDEKTLNAVKGNFIASVLENKNEETMDALIDSMYKNLFSDEGGLVSLFPTDVDQFETVSDLYAKTYNNDAINETIDKIDLVKDADTQVEPKKITDILNKYINSNNGEFFVDNNISIDDLLNLEALEYSKKSLTADSNIYTYKDSSKAQDLSDHVNAQLEAIDLTAELSSMKALKDARLRSASIRKGAVTSLEDNSVKRQVGGISANRYGLVAPHSVKESYDNFEDFFTNMYYDPLRLDHLNERSKLGTITSKEQKELDDITDYQYSIELLKEINRRIEEKSDGSYDPNYKYTLIGVVEGLTDAGEFNASEEDILELKTLAMAENPNPLISDPKIPYSNPKFTTKLTDILPAPVGQYFSLLQARNNAKFFIEEAARNKNIAEIGMSLSTQNEIYNQSLDIYANLIIPEIQNINGVDDILEDLTDLSGRILTIINDPIEKESATQESVKQKFNLEKDFLRILNRIETNQPKLDIIKFAKSNLGHHEKAKRYKEIPEDHGLGIVSDIMIAVEYDVDNFYATYRDLLKSNESIAKLVTGTPDVLQEKAALTVAGFLGSNASQNTDTKYISFIPGSLATGKSTYALGTGLKIHQLNNKGQVLMSANNRLQIDNIKKTGVDFQLDLYKSDTKFNLSNLLELLEDPTQDLSVIDTIVFDEATFIDASSWLEGVTKIDDNFTRISKALERINKGRIYPLQMVLLGDSDQNGYENSQPRKGEQYSGDQEVLDTEGAIQDLVPTQRNIGNTNIFGNETNGAKSIIRSRPLEAQYRSVSAEIPQAVSDARNLTIDNKSLSVVKDFELVTKFGYSEKEGKFLGVNVKTKFSDFSEDTEYVEYLSRRLSESTEEKPFKVGIASSTFSLDATQESNIEALGNLQEGSEFKDLAIQYPDNFILATHEEMQSQSLSFMVVDMDPGSFKTEAKLIQKYNEKRKLYTSIGRGIEHVVIVTRNRFPNIEAGKRDDNVSTHSEEIIQEAVDETRAFTIFKIGDDAVVTAAKSPDAPIPPKPTPPPSIPPGEGPKVKTPDGWQPMQSKEGVFSTEMKYLADNSWITRSLQKASSAPVYVHYVSVGQAVKDGELLEVHSAFRIADENSLEIQDVEFVPIGGRYAQAGSLVFAGGEYYRREDLKSPFDFLNITDIRNNLPSILEELGYQPLKEGISGTIDEEIRRINSKLKEKGSTYRTGLVPSHIGFDEDFASAQDATLALEEKAGITLVKNAMYSDVDPTKGAISINKLTDDRIFDRYRNNPEAYKIYTKEKGSKKNYLIEKLYNSDVRNRVQNAGDYKHKIMLVKDDDKATRAHIVSYESENENGVLSDPLIIGNLITADTYKIGTILNKAITTFEDSLSIDPNVELSEGVSRVDLTDNKTQDVNIIHYQMFDYNGNVHVDDTAPGSVIEATNNEFKADGSINSEYQEALQIVQYEDAFLEPMVVDGKPTTVRDMLLTADKTKFKEEFPAEIPVDILIKTLRSQGIHVFDNQFISLNTAEPTSGGSSLIFNQIQKGKEVISAAELISKKNKLRFIKSDHGRVGLMKGFGGINLNSKGVTLAEALTATKSVPPGALESEDYTVEENLDFSKSLTRNKILEMIEVFSIMGKTLSEVLGEDSTKTTLHKNLLEVYDEIQELRKKEETSAHYQGRESKTKAFTTKEVDDLRKKIVDLKQKDEGHVILLRNIILDMFGRNNLGVWLEDGSGFIESSKGTNDRVYLKDQSELNAPIQFIKSPNEAKYMPTINFSINKLINYIKSYTVPMMPDGTPVVSPEQLASLFDSMLSQSKFANGIYINLDKVYNADRNSHTVYYAVAQQGKIAGKDNLDLFSTLGVGLTNPNIALDLETIERSLLEDAEVVEGDEVSDVEKANLLRKEFSNTVVATFESSVKRRADLYEDIKLEDLKEDAIDTIYSMFFKNIVDSYSDSLEDLVSIEEKNEIVNKAKDKILDKIVKEGLSINTDDDIIVDLNAEYGVESLTDIFTNKKVYSLGLAPIKQYSKILEVLAVGSDIIYDQKYLDRMADATKHEVRGLFPKNIANQITALISERVKEVTAKISDKSNQITVKERLALAPDMLYLSKLPKKQNMSIQELLLAIKTAEKMLDSEIDNQGAIESLADYTTQLKNKLSSPTKGFKDHMNANWMYVGMDMGDVNQAYIERWQELNASDLDEDVLSLEEAKLEEQFRARSEAFSKPGFEVSLREKQKGKNFEIVDYAENWESKSPQAHFIYNLPGHINSTLLFKIDGKAANQDAMIKHYSELKKSDYLAAKEAVGLRIDSIDEKIKYLSTINTYNSELIIDALANSSEVLTTIKRELVGVIAESETVIPNIKPAALDGITDERYKEIKEVLNTEINDHPEKRVAFEEASTGMISSRKAISEILKGPAIKEDLKSDAKSILVRIIETRCKK